jgi:alkyl hydroperoxide reductase subunit AhpF
MSILDERTREQLRDRFAERLSGPVELTLYARPGTGRLILPSGLGCATCEDAREVAEALREAAPEKIALEVVDVTQAAAPVSEVPTLTVGRPGEEPRIAWQGLTAGYEFATVVDAIERASRSEPGLSDESLAGLARLEQQSGELEILVFATPT